MRFSSIRNDSSRLGSEPDSARAIVLPEVIASDANGLLYVLMSPNGKEGSHKDGGTEVWVVDPVKKARLSRIALKGQGLAIAVTREDVPQLIVARADGVIDVHDAATGAFVRTLGATVAANPIVITVP